MGSRAVPPAGLRRSPAGFFVLCLAGMVVLAMTAPGPALLRGAARLGGLPLLAAGVALHGAAARRLRTWATTMEPRERPTVLVEDGVYAWTRNPMYTAGVPILLGLALLLGATTPLLVVPLYVACTHRWFIRPEEEVLGELFGERYGRYRERVRRWV